jgi:hypothetical protein
MRSTQALFCLGVTVALAAGVGLAPGCAKSLHETPDLDAGADGGTVADGGSHDDGHTPPPAGDAAVCMPPAPPVLGVSVFADTCSGGAPTVDWSPMRRVSRLEYDNMVRDLVGDTTQPASNFVEESPMATGVNLQTNTYGGVSELITQQYLLTAETLAATAVLDVAAGDSGPAVDNLTAVYTLNHITPCTTQDDACAQQFITAFASRAFRGPIDATESTGLFSLYSSIANAPNNLGFRTGIRAVITSVLSSPHFLYVIELGDGSKQAAGAPLPLSQYEIAARLAFFLWRSLPDVGTGSLTAAAAAGMLSTPAQIQAQTQRMLADPKARDAINDFTTQWVELQAAPAGKDTIFTNWSKSPAPGLGPEMKDETLTNVAQLVLVSNGTLTDLLTSPMSYVNADLATFYGATLGSGPAVTVADSALTGSQTQFVQTTLPNRAGILTNGSTLAIQSHSLLPSSVLRGKLVREDLLCDPISPPPPGVPAVSSTVPDGGTTRQIFQAHAEIGGTTGKGVFCYGCHEYMDWIGFGLGHYDATGAYQATDENGSPSGPVLDVTGQFFPVEPGELNQTFDGATDPSTGLVAVLAGSTQAKECFALQEFRYALGRIESKSDACSIQQFYSAFTGSSLNIQKLLLAIVATDAFRYRSAEPAGDACASGSSCK